MPLSSDTIPRVHWLSQWIWCTETPQIHHQHLSVKLYTCSCTTGILCYSWYYFIILCTTPYNTRSNSLAICNLNLNAQIFSPSIPQIYSPTNVKVALSYLDTSHISQDNLAPSVNKPTLPHTHDIPTPNTLTFLAEGNLEQQPIEQYIAYTAKKKYKPVALKVKSVICKLPDKFHILQNITGDPLKDLPILETDPPPFTLTGWYTQERKGLFDKLNPGFLWPVEQKLLNYFMMVHQNAFTWESLERGHFKEKYFPPIEIPIILHTPWVHYNIPIPPGLHKEVCRLIQDKIDAGIFETSNSSYQSQWFCIVKKDCTSLCIVQSLEPLNAVTIQHSGIPPFTE